MTERLGSDILVCVLRGGFELPVEDEISSVDDDGTTVWWMICCQCSLTCTIRCVGVGSFYRLPGETVRMDPVTTKIEKKNFLKGGYMGRKGPKVAENRP